MRVIAGCVRSLLVLGLLLAASGTPTRAAESKAPAQPPKVGEVLGAMSKYLAKQKEFGYHAEVVFDQVLPGGPKIQLSGAVDVGVKRPGSLFVYYRDDVTSRIVWFEKGKLTLFDPVASTYAVVSGPKSIDAMVAKLEKDDGVTLPLGDLAESDPEAVLSKGVEVAHYVGVHDVEGVACHHILLQRPDLDVQVFVELGDKPLPRKLVFDYVSQPGSPQFTASITDWSFDPLPADLFTAKLPEDAASVEFLPVGRGR
jgi:hypothetical protein